MARPKKVLISGAGVAGPAVAWWLHHFGFEPSIVEIAPQFRTGGYMIDFWGKGFDLIERMGLLPEVERSGYRIKEVRFVHADGSRAAGFSTDGFQRATGGRFTSLPRSDLAGIIWRGLPASIETRFGDEVARLEPEGESVRVHFARAQAETFDLVIGADGLHSKLRELVFGPEDRFETFLGYAFAAFTVAGYGPRTPDTYLGFGVPGRHASRVSMRDDRTLVLLIWRDERSSLPSTDEGRRALLKDRFAGMGWETDLMLETLDGATDLYVDSISQIHLPRWSDGRIGLVGDAAWAPSFLAGEGCGLGIMGAYVLAGELARSGGDPVAFARYESRLRGFIESKQKMATRFGGAFCPSTRFGLIFRNWVASLLNIRPIANLALSASIKDEIELPDYPAATGKTELGTAANECSTIGA
ncbi:MAG TPA: FAD-binding domain [Sphingomicrobium sp.]|jgi:2-polyprenyl-6-methoxyphenol hydroxylase-like FAD-dependent oxidoreductase